LKGVARGVAGFGIKPAVGVVDLVTRTAEGIRNTTTYWDEKHRLRVRPPRYFGGDRVLQPYNLEKSEGQELLFTIEEGKYQTDFYMFHIDIENSVIIISDNHVISINRFNIKLEEWNVCIKGMRS
jgi:vacuolar protein sorting-associated protein 13A/C